MATHANVGIGHGCTITFASSFFANVEDLEWSGISRDAIETTHMETSGGQTYLPGGNYDPGSLSVTWQHDPAEVTPPVTSSAEACTVTFSPSIATATSTSGHWSALAFMTDYGVTCPDKDKMMASATLKFTGNITFATSA